MIWEDSNIGSVNVLFQQFLDCPQTDAKSVEKQRGWLFQFIESSLFSKPTYTKRGCVYQPFELHCSYPNIRMSQWWLFGVILHQTDLDDQNFTSTRLLGFIRMLKSLSWFPSVEHYRRVNTHSIKIL